MEDKQSLGEHVLEVKDIGDGKKEMTVKLPELPSPEINKTIASSGTVINRFADSYFQVADYTGNFTRMFETALKLPTNPHQQMALAREIYITEPTVRTCLDLMVDFSISGFENECDNKDVKKFYDEWCRKVNMDEVLRWIFLEFYRSANVSIYKAMNKSKLGRPATKTSTNYEKELVNKIYPVGYTVLNPLYVHVEGPLLFNQEVLVLKLPSDSQNLVQGNTQQTQILNNLPSQLKKAFETGGAQRIELDQKLVSRITRKRQPYERYAVPFLYSIFEPVIMKEKLKKMDLSVIEGLINQLVTVTVGNDTYPATDEQLKAVAELFATPNKAYSIFWNHTLEVKFHKPEGLETLTQDKYNQVNMDILAGLGITRTLIDGGGSNKGGGGYSSAWVSILALIEKLENGRNQIKRWLENEYKLIAEENGFETYPSVRFDKMNLRQDTTIKNILLAMYDRGLLSLETLLTETGYDFDIELSRKKVEKKDQELFLPPQLPFSGEGGGGVSDDGKPKKMMPNEGRPSGGEGLNDYKKDRKTKIDPGGDKPPKVKKASFNLDNYKSSFASYRDELEVVYEELEEELMALALMDLTEEERDKRSNDVFAFFFASFMTAGRAYILGMFDDEYSKYHFNDSYEFVQNRKAELLTWHEQYVEKLVNDLKTTPLNNPAHISAKFQSEAYRVKLFAQEGLRNGFIQGQIAGNIAIGSTEATWLTRADGRVCPQCRSLHGKSFPIHEVPIIPAHVNCRCMLHFN